MAICVYGACKELYGRAATAGKICSRDQIARIAVRVRKGVCSSFQIRERLGSVADIGDQIGLIERLAPPLRHTDQSQSVLMLQIGIPANPRRFDRPVQQHGGDFLIGPTLNEYGWLTHGR